MKKIITLLFLFTIILNIIYQKEETIPVYNELTTTHYLLQEKDIYNNLYLNIEKLNITTKHYNLLNDLQIIGVFYKIPPLHQNLFKTNYYKFKNDNLDENINILEQNYIQKLNENTLTNEVNKIYLNGLKIKKS